MTTETTTAQHNCKTCKCDNGDPYRDPAYRVYCRNCEGQIACRNCYHKDPYADEYVGGHPAAY